MTTLYTIDEIASALGISPPNVYRAARSGVLPSTIIRQPNRPQGIYGIQIEDALAWQAAKRHPSTKRPPPQP